MEGENFSRQSVDESIRQMKDLYNELGFLMTNYHLRIFKEMIKGLEEDARRKAESLEAASKKGFSFKSKFQFKSIDARAKEQKKEEKRIEAEPQITSKALALVAETKDKSDTHIVITDQQGRNQYRLANLTNCRIEVKAPLKTIYLNSLKNCRISCGIIDGSLFGDKIEDCEICVTAQQIRIHNSRKTTFKIFVVSSMIIEDCVEIKVGELKPQEFAEEEKRAFEGSKFASAGNNWREVKDFNWIKDTPSPNIIFI